MAWDPIAKKPSTSRNPNHFHEANSQEFKYFKKLLEWWAERTKPKIAENGAVIIPAKGRAVLAIKDLALDGRSRFFFDGVFEVCARHLAMLSIASLM